VPGALEFIRFVENAGVTPFFITSRLNATRLSTLENLEALGVLSADNLKNEKAWAGDADKTVLPKNTRLFMKGMDTVNTPTPSTEKGKDWPMKDKFDHRMWVSGWRGFEIILSVGDNLGDYAEYYGRVYDKSAHTFYEKNPSVCGEKVKDPVSGVEVCDLKPKLDGMHPSLAERRAAVLQDAALFGRDFVLIPNPTYGGWLRAFEANQIGSSDELAYTPAPVREPLDEPQKPFTYANPKAGQPGELPETTKTAAGPKFDAKNQLRIWDGK
jgi:predicted secreted acid phosphatase